MGSILGTIIRGDTRPKIPPLKAIDVGDEQQKAIENNLQALPGAENLASQTNTFNQQQIEQMLQQAIPNYNELVSGVSKNILSQVHGELPQDVQDAIQLNAASQSLSGGYSGTGMQGALTARDLGLSSLSLIRGGMDSASRWIQSMNSLYSPGLMNVTSMFLTPQQQLAADVNERNSQWEVQWMRNQRKAMPNQYQEAIAGLFDNIEQLGRSVLSAYAGGAVGGGGGMGMGGGGGGSSNPYADGNIAGANYQSGGPGAIQTGTYR